MFAIVKHSRIISACLRCGALLSVSISVALAQPPKSGELVETIRGGTSKPRTDAAEGSIAAVYSRARRASLEILVDGRIDGSGWISTADGIGFTAWHVIRKNPTKVEAFSRDLGRMEVELLAVDRGRDLALIKLPTRREPYPFVPLAKKVPPPGENVYLLGAPLFRHSVLLRGMMARDDTVFEYYGSEELYVEIMHVACTVQAQTSGSPWLNDQGEVIGLQSGTLMHSGTPIGVAHISPVAGLANLLSTRRSVENADLGVAVEELWQQSSETRKKYPPRTEGLIARVVVPSSAAANAGLKQWDLIVALDDRPIKLTDDLIRAVRQRKPGDKVKLTVQAPDGKRRELTATLDTLAPEKRQSGGLPAGG